MPTKTKDLRISKELETGDYATSETKKMLLPMSPEIHAWVKNMAEAVHLTYPKVVEMVLQQALQVDPSEYAGRIERQNAAKRLEELKDQEQALKHEKERLTTLLES